MHDLRSGIRLLGTSVSNIILQNLFNSNLVGVIFAGDAVDLNFILSNEFTCMEGGISIGDGDRNIIGFNNIHNNNSSGMFLSGTTAQNYIVHNSIYSNTSVGINVNSSGGADNNYFISLYKK